jgi:hypothetical protein
MNSQPAAIVSEDATEPVNGAIQEIEGRSCIYFDGYWIRYYKPPADTLAAKKRLIDALTKRTFHHTEAGINTPGEKLELVREAYLQQTDPQRRRVNAAILAGALFNRATDIFTTIVDLEQKGITITRENELMKQCSECFMEALDLSENVKHHSGEEGVDELWGEPVKVFTMPISDYYSSRYRKIAQAMKGIDLIGETLKLTLCIHDSFDEVMPLIDDFVEIAKKECEILRSDTDYYEVWPEFVADGEKLSEFLAPIPRGASSELERHIKRGTLLLRGGKNLITWVASVRVPMPVSTQAFLDKCEHYRDSAS